MIRPGQSPETVFGENNNLPFAGVGKWLITEYYYINAAEICFFIARFKSGKYGRFYGSIDPLKITSAMLDYVSERRKDIERKERERYRNQREKEIEERGNNRISYAEYIEIKHRADAGDEEARKMLISP